MKRFPALFGAVAGIALAAMIVAAARAQTPSVTIPAQTLTVVIPAQTVPVLVTAVNPPPPPPPSGAFWVYRNGVFAWLGSYDYGGHSNLKDTSGIPMDGPYDVSFTTTQAGGSGWQPYVIPSGQSGGTLGFNVSPYTKLHFCIKPTVPGDQFGGGFAANNDAPDGTPIQVFAGPNTTKYGPVPVVGVWGCYTLPLADYALTNPLILKFSISSGTFPDQWFMDDVGFIP